MKKSNLTRRQFICSSSAGVIAAASPGIPAFGNISKNVAKPALLGGQPVRTKPFTSWPFIDAADEKSVLAALRSGKWSRGELVADVEKKFAKLTGSPYCLLTGSGTQSLNTAVHVLGIGAGDEVLVTPYTFVATVEAILLEDALPVFVDVDPATYQIDPDKLEGKITENTRAILPVHIGGGVAHMDKINAFARRHNLCVIEDACQSILAEWKGKKVGTLSDLGCFSFQTSKNLTCGEGGAILSEDEELIDRCYSFHNFGRPKGRFMTRDKGGHPILGTKYRISTIHAALLSVQMERVEEQTRKRTENANYLTSKLADIPCVVPRKEYPETTRILGVLEGFPINREGLIEDTLNSKTFQKIYSPERLAEYREKNFCPESDRLSEEVMGFHGDIFLGTKKDMDDIADAILKIYENKDALI